MDMNRPTIGQKRLQEKEEEFPCVPETALQSLQVSGNKNENKRKLDQGQKVEEFQVYEYKNKSRNMFTYSIQKKENEDKNKKKNLQILIKDINKNNFQDLATQGNIVLSTNRSNNQIKENKIVQYLNQSEKNCKPILGEILDTNQKKNQEIEIKNSSGSYQDAQIGNQTEETIFLEYSDDKCETQKINNNQKELQFQDQNLFQKQQQFQNDKENFDNQGVIEDSQENSILQPYHNNHQCSYQNNLDSYIKEFYEGNQSKDQEKKQQVDKNLIKNDEQNQKLNNYQKQKLISSQFQQNQSLDALAYSQINNDNQNNFLNEQQIQEEILKQELEFQKKQLQLEKEYKQKQLLLQLDFARKKKIEQQKFHKYNSTSQNKNNLSSINTQFTLQSNDQEVSPLLIENQNQSNIKQKQVQQMDQQNVVKNLMKNLNQYNQQDIIKKNVQEKLQDKNINQEKLILQQNKQSQKIDILNKYNSNHNQNLSRANAYQHYKSYNNINEINKRNGQQLNIKISNQVFSNLNFQNLQAATSLNNKQIQSANYFLQDKGQFQMLKQKIEKNNNNLSNGLFNTSLTSQSSKCQLGLKNNNDLNKNNKIEKFQLNNYGFFKQNDQEEIYQSGKLLEQKINQNSKYRSVSHQNQNSNHDIYKSVYDQKSQNQQIIESNQKFNRQLVQSNSCQSIQPKLQISVNFSNIFDKTLSQQKSDNKQGSNLKGCRSQTQSSLKGKQFSYDQNNLSYDKNQNQNLNLNQNYLNEQIKNNKSQRILSSEEKILKKYQQIDKNELIKNQKQYSERIKMRNSNLSLISQENKKLFL
ncbi:hypothetical protein PPERSA_13085 [Pseudocohnilembus persalinus]|uniref:Uncharacterized protein n=1 Tax=Pseudocohnilembus persalinus TaxID=266149 RepID=A0A0V0QWK9_PSEPJ|nr:hypothetical protein PPERSA_13085 [Pseudocohnilembus persalinus]|eukprot:KRX06606.1 hypothetical protein PPERSA_13085 [Pseudocohnilembus persalinus]